MMTYIEYQRKATDILKLTREQSGKTQQEVADLIGVTRQTVNNWECGYSFPNLPLVLKWFDILQTDKTFFINYQNDKLLEEIKKQAIAIVDIIDNRKGVKNEK